MYTTMNRSSAQWVRLLFLNKSRLGNNQQHIIGLRGFAASPPPTALAVGVDKRQTDITHDSKTAVPSSPPRRDPLDLSFNNAEAAFRSKTTWQVLRAYLVFTLCSSNYLVENNMKVNLLRNVYNITLELFSLQTIF